MTSPHLLPPVIVKTYSLPQANFGDLLTLPILQFVAQQVDPRLTFVHCSDPQQADIIGIGSILSNAKPSCGAYIWTTGTARPKETKALGNARVMAVRGAKTWALCGSGALGKDPALGDGGLLLRYMYPEKSQTKRFRLGLVPHVIDYETLVKTLSRHPDITVIDLRKPIPVVIEQIKACQVILSSSLHGLVAADSFDIPNGMAHFANSRHIIGGLFKYQDYYSTFGFSDVPFLLPQAHTQTPEMLLDYAEQVMKQYQRPNIETTTQRLLDQTRLMLQELALRTISLPVRIPLSPTPPPPPPSSSPVTKSVSILKRNRLRSLPRKPVKSTNR